MQIEIHGHRGCRGYMPENTIAGFLHAVELGVTAIELDVVVTGCGKILVSHEPWMNHEFCLDDRGNPITEYEQKQFNIFKMSYADVVKYNCGVKQHHRFPNQILFPAYKPLLKDVLFAVEYFTSFKKLKPVHYNIEIKSVEEEVGLFQPPHNLFCDLLMQELSCFELNGSYNLQSFDIRVLNYLHKEHSQKALAILVDEKETYLSKFQSCSFKPQTCSPYYKLVSNEMVAYCHSQNIKVIPWTVNEVSEMERLIALGIDGIITDYPKRLIKLLN